MACDVLTVIIQMFQFAEELINMSDMLKLCNLIMKVPERERSFVHPNPIIVIKRGTNFVGNLNFGSET